MECDIITLLWVRVILSAMLSLIAESEPEEI